MTSLNEVMAAQGLCKLSKIMDLPRSMSSEVQLSLGLQILPMCDSRSSCYEHVFFSSCQNTRSKSTLPLMPLLHSHVESDGHSTVYSFQKYDEYLRH